MNQTNQNPTDDFFSILEKEERIENPFDDDEILYKDASGNIRSIRGNLVEPAKASATQSASNVSTKVKIAAGKPRNLETEINQVVKLSGIHFNDVGLEKRFKKIVESTLRSVRGPLETRENFMDSIVNGGLGFNSEQADKVMVVINQEKGKLENRLRQEISRQPFADLQAEAAALLQGVVEPELKTQFAEKPVAVFKPAPAVKITPAVKTIDQRPTVKPEQPPAPRPASIARVVARSDGSKPKLEDVKFKPKLTGPVEEIGSLTVNDFRRLGASPEQAIQKILEKIAILEEESFSKKTQAITAWKDSPVNRLYLELGDESIENKISISQVITTRQQNNQPYLSEEEVDAVIQLNRKLRY